MLATLTSRPFDRAGWVFEEKYDGDRILAYKEDHRIRLLSRSGEDRTDRLPGIAQAIRSLKPSSLLLDGEAVVFDRRGVSRFQLLQQGEGEASYAVFDCLFCGGKDVRGESLATRRTVMENAIGSSRVLLPSQRLASNGLKAFRLAKRRGYEGLVAKDLASHYVEGRSSKWLKVKVHQEDEFVIAGFTKPAGSASISVRFCLVLMRKDAFGTSVRWGPDLARERWWSYTHYFTRSFGSTRRSPNPRPRVESLILRHT